MFFIKITFALLLYTMIIFAQPTFITREAISSDKQINEQIIRLVEFLNSKNLNQIGMDSVNRFLTKGFIYRISAHSSKSDSNYMDFSSVVQKLDIKGNLAEAIVSLSYRNIDGLLEEETVNLSFVKEECWKFDKLGSIENLFMILIKSFPNEDPQLDGYSVVQPIISNYTFHKIPILTPQGGDPIYELNYKTTMDVFNKQLFAANQGLSWAGWYWGPNQYNQYYKLGLILDQGWKRIVFSKDALDGVIRLYDYGRSSGNLQFDSPRSIDMNEFNEIFVADDVAKCIYKLNYNFYSNTISAPSQPIFISNPNYISKPVSIDYYSGTTYGNPSDDRIVIADEGLDCITIFDGLGVYKGKITKFWVSGIGYVQISNPRSAVLYGFQNPYRIAFIDGGSNSLVCGFLNEAMILPPYSRQEEKQLYL